MCAYVLHFVPEECGTIDYRKEHHQLEKAKTRRRREREVLTFLFLREKEAKVEAEVRTCNKTGDFSASRAFGVYGANKKANKCHFNLSQHKPSFHIHFTTKPTSKSAAPSVWRNVRN